MNSINTQAPFSTKLKEIPGATLSHRFIDVEAMDGSEIDTREIYAQEHYKDHYAEKVVLTNDYAIVGALVIDDDAQDSNPIENDCAGGDIFHHSRGKKDEQASFYEAIGYDSYGDKNFDHDGVLKNLGAVLIQAVFKDKGLVRSLSWILRKNPSAKSSSHEAVKACLIQACKNGASYEDFGSSFCGRGIYTADDLTKSHLETAHELADSLLDDAWGLAVKNGDIGDPLAVMLDIYEHSGVSYSLHREGMQCPWDTSICAAVWVPNACALENIRTSALKELGIGQIKWSGSIGGEQPLNAAFSLDGGGTWMGGFSTWSETIKAMMEASPKKVSPDELQQVMQKHSRDYARGLIEEYSKWCGGEVYGITTLVIDRENGEVVSGEVDSSWGFIGMNYAEQELEDAMLYLVKKYSEKKVEPVA